MKYLKNRRFDKTQHILDEETNRSLCDYIDPDNRGYYEISEAKPEKLCRLCHKARTYPADLKKFVFQFDDAERVPVILDAETLAKLEALTEGQIETIFQNNKFNMAQFKRGSDIYAEFAADWLANAQPKGE